MKLEAVQILRFVLPCEFGNIGGMMLLCGFVLKIRTGCAESQQYLFQMAYSVPHFFESLSL
jgi:hypothetical protein